MSQAAVSTLGGESQVAALGSSTQRAASILSFHPQRQVAERPPPARESRYTPRKALGGVISKVNFIQVCQFLTTISHKMAPRTRQSEAGTTPRRAFCGIPRPDEARPTPDRE